MLRQDRAEGTTAMRKNIFVGVGRKGKQNHRSGCDRFLKMVRSERP